MIEKLKSEMIRYYSGDPKRVQHFIKVYFFCEMIGNAESLSDGEMLVLRAAALTHDIGIKRAEELYNSASGKYQEELGPEIARKMLETIGFSQNVIDRVCFLIANHHTYTDIDSLDYQILVEADFLVNLYEDNCPTDSVKSVKEKIFKTAVGTKILDEMFLSNFSDK